MQTAVGCAARARDSMCSAAVRNTGTPAKAQLVRTGIRAWPAHVAQARRCWSREWTLTAVAHGRRATVVSRAAAARSATVVEVPADEEQAVRDAAAAVRAQLTAAVAALGSEGASREQLRLRVEIPSTDRSAAGGVYLAGRLLSKLESTRLLMKLEGPAKGVSRLSGQGWSLVVCSGGGRRATTPRGARLCEPLSAFGGCDSLEGPLMLVQPLQEQLESLSTLLADTWSGRVVVIINAGWDETQSAASPLVESFQHVYAFRRIAVQGASGTAEVALVKVVDEGPPADTPWIIASKEGGLYTEVTRTSRVPSPQDLEAAFTPIAGTSLKIIDLPGFA